MPPTDTPTLARSFYQRFLASDDRVAFLKALVNSSPPTFETEWLEFKMYPQEDNDQKNDQKIKEFWCINLSAFANMQGGVLIWGIGAKKIDKVDAAWSHPLVPSPDALRTKLFELHHLATDPPLSGVEIEAVTVPNEDGKGFVICFIPQGVFVPYRAEFNIKNYYMRVGDDSIIVSPVILRRLFYPQSLAKLEMRVILSSSRKEYEGRPTDLWKYEVFLKNAGRGTAHEVYVLICDNVPYNTALGKGLYHGDNWQTKVSFPNKSGFYSQIPIHPDFPTQVATSYEWNPAGHGVYEGRIYPAFPTLRIRMFVFCRDNDQQIFEVDFERSDFTDVDVSDKDCIIVTDPSSLGDL
jgi:hypothetical protein